MSSMTGPVAVAKYQFPKFGNIFVCLHGWFHFIVCLFVFFRFFYWTFTGLYFSGNSFLYWKAFRIVGY